MEVTHYVHTPNRATSLRFGLSRLFNDRETVFSRVIILYLNAKRVLWNLPFRGVLELPACPWKEGQNVDGNDVSDAKLMVVQVAGDVCGCILLLNVNYFVS